LSEALHGLQQLRLRDIRWKYLEILVRDRRVGRCGVGASLLGRRDRGGHQRSGDDRGSQENVMARLCVFDSHHNSLIY
jgi:hypothetical protein